MRISDWSSDVCSSDLACGGSGRLGQAAATPNGQNRRGSTGRTRWPVVNDGKAAQHDDDVAWHRCGSRKPALGQFLIHFDYGGKCLAVRQAQPCPQLPEFCLWSHIVPLRFHVRWSALLTTKTAVCESAGGSEIGREHVWTPVPNAHLVCR